MTYDTTTSSTDIVLVRSVSNNESDREVSPDPSGAHATNSHKNERKVESQSETDGDLYIDEHDVTSPSKPALSSSPKLPGSTHFSELNTHKSEKDARCLALDNNNIVVNPVDGSEDTLSGTSQVSNELCSNDYSAIKEDIDVGKEKPAICYNPVLDDEIRNRLDKLNALSDLINSLEVQFDHANMLFRETLKCSTDRLSTIAKTLGSKSIRQGRIYQEAKISVEQTQTNCQRACVQFEQANHDHQFAKEAIRNAETRLKQMNSSSKINPSGTELSDAVRNSDFELEELRRLSLTENDKTNQARPKYSENTCDSRTINEKSNSLPTSLHNEVTSYASGECEDDPSFLTHPISHDSSNHIVLNINEESDLKILDSAKLSEDLNQAINRLLDAEQKRRQSEKLHFDQANKLMIAQENLLKLEREHGASIRRSQVYFDEARKFNIRLTTVKRDIAKISEEIIAAKQAYARALEELEQFSEDLHLNSNNLPNLKDTSDLPRHNLQAVPGTEDHPSDDQSNLTECQEVDSKGEQIHREKCRD